MPKITKKDLKIISKGIVKTFLNILVYITINFIIFRLPSMLGIVSLKLLYGLSSAIPEEPISEYNKFKRHWGFYKFRGTFSDWLNHYLVYLKNLLTFDFHYALKYGYPLNFLILNHLYITLIYLIPSLILAIFASTRLCYIFSKTENEKKQIFDFNTLILLMLPVIPISIFLRMYLKHASWYSFEYVSKIMENYMDPFTKYIKLIIRLSPILIVTTIILTIDLFNNVKDSLAINLKDELIKLEKAKGLSEDEIRGRLINRLALIEALKRIKNILPFIWLPIIMFEYMLEVSGIGQFIISTYDNNVYIALELTMYVMVLTTLIIKGFLDIIIKLIDPREKYQANASE